MSLIYESLTSSGTISAAGGAKGLGGTANTPVGTDGVVGSAGIVIQMQMVD